MRIVFFGTPNFAAQILEYLVENKIEIVCVVTQPDRKRGRSKKDPIMLKIWLRNYCQMFLF